MVTQPVWRRLLPLTVQILPMALILLAVAGVLLGLQRVPFGQPALPLHGETLETLKGQIVELERRAGWLQWNLTLILTAAALFAIAQGAFAYFNAQSFIKQADEAVKRIEELSKEVRAQYPMFTNAETARKNAFAALGRAFTFRNWNWKLNPYREMPLKDRQQVFSVENFVGLEFLQPASDSDYIQEFRGMGNFYFYKFLDEGRSLPADFDRARYYLQIALERSGRSFGVLNDIGVLYHQHSEPPTHDDLREARSCLEESHSAHPEQQRAQYDLAGIEHDAERFDQSIALLQNALGQTLWEDEHVPALESNIRYNLACSLCRKAAGAGPSDEQRALLQRALAELAAARTSGDISQANTDSDLKFLRESADTALRLEFEELMKNTGPAETPPPVRWKDRLQNAWHALKG